MHSIDTPWRLCYVVMNLGIFRFGLLVWILEGGKHGIGIGKVLGWGDLVQDKNGRFGF